METTKYVLPEEMYEFRRGDRFLFFDPVNFVWFQTDRLGKGVVDGLRKGSPRDAASEVARLATAPREDAEAYVHKYVRQLLELGFVHEDRYEKKQWADGLVKSPFILYLHMTSRCNLRCPYCYNQEHRLKIWRTPMSTEDQLFRVVDEAAELGFFEIKLTGGEALLHPATLAVGRHAKSCDLRVNLLTNGTLVTEKNAAEIVGAVHSVSLSLDSPIPEEHEVVRGKNTHGKVLRAIRLLKEAGLEFLHLNAVVTPVNKDSVEAFLAYAWDELQAQKVTLAASSIAVEDSDDRFDAARYMLTAKEVGAVLEKRQEFDRRRWGRSQVTARSLRRTQCGAANGVVSVDSNGDLYPCQTMHTPELCCGNVFETSLREVLETSGILRRVKHLTSDHLEDCRTCAMRYICAGGCRMEAYSRVKRLDGRPRDLCPVFFRRSLSKLWDAANTPFDARTARAEDVPFQELC